MDVDDTEIKNNVDESQEYESSTEEIESDVEEVSVVIMVD